MTDRKPAIVQRNQIESSQLPDLFEFENVPDTETLVSLKEGFVIKIPEIRLGDWRFTLDGADLVLQKYVSSVWVEQTRFVP